MENNKKRNITIIHQKTRTTTKNNRKKLQKTFPIINIRQKMDKKILKQKSKKIST